jgi:arabinogalactan endo-1,4-beta-galactosidase
MLRLFVLVLLLPTLAIAQDRLPTPGYHTQPSDPEWLAQVVQLHGHLGPSVVAGARMGMIGLHAVDARRYFDIEVACEGQLAHLPQSCFLDGFQAATGAATGKQTLNWTHADNLAVLVKNTRSVKTAELRPTPAPTDLLASFKPVAKAGKGHRPEQQEHECLEAIARTIAALPVSEVAGVNVADGQVDSAARRPHTARSPFILGADISWVQQQEDEGVHFMDHGKQADILAILKSRGFNWIRLRIFHEPKVEKGYSRQGYCDLYHTLQLARRIQAARLRLLLDFHYSDNWADPGHQAKPRAWADLHGAELEKAVHDHTRDVVAALKRQGTPPNVVQIGNEISNGFLWPDGNVWKSGKWDEFCGLIKAGIAGVKEADPSVKIMLHLAWGGQNAQSRSFLDKALAQSVEFDIIGQSYYPKWHGTLDDLEANLTDLSGRYKQEIIVVEYSVPDIRQINDIVHGLPGGKGLGTFIWEPTKWEGPALFDAKGSTKPEIEVYRELAKKYGTRMD